MTLDIVIVIELKVKIIDLPSVKYVRKEDRFINGHIDIDGTRTLMLCLV